MRWEFFFVLFLDDDDDVGATWESDNFIFLLFFCRRLGWIETLVKTHTKREQNRPKKKGRPR